MAGKEILTHKGRVNASIENDKQTADSYLYEEFLASRCQILAYFDFSYYLLPRQFILLFFKLKLV